MKLKQVGNQLKDTTAGRQTNYLVNIKFLGSMNLPNSGV